MNFLSKLTGKNKKMLIIGFLCLVLPPILRIPGYFQYTINLTGIYMIVAVGLNLLLGYTGQISIGHAAFMAIGAYTSALLVMKAGWSFWLGVPAGGVVACLIGMILGLPALRLHGHYLAIATLGFGVAVTQIMSTMELTGGYSGIMPPPPTVFGTDIWGGPIDIFRMTLEGDLIKYYIVLLFVAITFYLARNIVKSRTGRAFMAIRDSEVAAKAMGVDISKFKVISFGMSAFFTGIAGGLYAHLVGFISPHDFNLGMSLNFFAMIVIGGMGSLRGAIYGAIFMTMVPELFSRIQNLPSVLMGASIILVSLFLPGGIVTIEYKIKLLLKKLFSKKTVPNQQG